LVLAEKAGLVVVVVVVASNFSTDIRARQPISVIEGMDVQIRMR
jgi:hypothetical protein